MQPPTGHCGGVCTAPPRQNWSSAQGHVAPPVPAVHAESSSSVTDAHANVTFEHDPRFSVPWHDVASLHVGAVSKNVHCVSALQHVPPTSQQIPFSQWPDTQSESSSQVWPFGRSAMHVPSQWQLPRHSPSAVHDVGQDGVVCVAVPLHVTGW